MYTWQDASLRELTELVKEVGAFCGHAWWVMQLTTACLLSSGRPDIAAGEAQELVKQWVCCGLCALPVLGSLSLAGVKGCLLAIACRTCVSGEHFCVARAEMLRACLEWLAGQ